MKKYLKGLERVINLIFVGCIISVVLLISEILLFSSFKIPSNSMAPELISGDYVLVCKPIIGARLFNVFATLQNKQVEIYRAPGFRSVKRNDVLVFNNPYPTVG